MERFNYFNTVSLVICFAFIGVDCLGLKYFFERWADVEIHQIKQCLPVLFKFENVDYHNTVYLTVKTHDV